ncbi:hypothetical protein HK101_004956 [Irineochytrium annulatum]|nr:hypothetical protein HK101_004956 [Irineochytrium annulatum]
MRFLTALIVLAAGALAQSPPVTNDPTSTAAGGDAPATSSTPPAASTPVDPASSIIPVGGPGPVVTPTSSAVPVQITNSPTNPITIVHPLAGQTYNVGDIINITWTVADPAVSAMTVTFYWEDVRKSANLGTALPGSIASVPISAMQYSAKVPATLPGAGNWGIKGTIATVPLPTDVYSNPFMVNIAVSTTTTTTTAVKTTTTMAATVAAWTTTTMSGASSVAGKAAAVCLAAPLALALLF